LPQVPMSAIPLKGKRNPLLGRIPAAAVEWAEREIPDVPVIASIMVSNKPSIRVAERLGFKIHTEEEFAGEPSLHLRR
jgi:hypothetical protein